MRQMWIKLMIDETKTRIPCWLVWSTTERGVVTLEAIGLTNTYAKQARTVLLSSGRFISVRIELSECNHLFGPDLDETWWKMYGEAAKERGELLIDGSMRKRNLLLETQLKELWQSCVALMPNIDRDVVGFDAVRKVMYDIQLVLPQIGE
jgi:hypothetical protein